MFVFVTYLEQLCIFDEQIVKIYSCGFLPFGFFGIWRSHLGSGDKLLLERRNYNNNALQSEEVGGKLCHFR